MKLIENFSVKNGRLTKEDNEIKFTKTEKKIIELLEKNDNQLTTIEELEEKVWYGKKFSVFTLRNAIAEIRKKTWYFIKKWKAERRTGCNRSRWTRASFILQG